MQQTSDFLPSYKQEFLATLSREPQSPSQDSPSKILDGKKTKSSAIGLLTKTTSTNDVWNKTAYTTPEWKQYVCTSLYKNDFTDKEFNAGDIVNPEAGDRLFNMRRTQISEYGNALFNSEPNRFNIKTEPTSF